MKKSSLISALLLSATSMFAQSATFNDRIELPRESNGTWQWFAGAGVGATSASGMPGKVSLPEIRQGSNVISAQTLDIGSSTSTMLQTALMGGVKYKFPASIWTYGLRGQFNYSYGKVKSGPHTVIGEFQGSTNQYSAEVSSNYDVNTYSLSVIPFIEANLDYFNIYAGLGVGIINADTKGSYTGVLTNPPITDNTRSIGVSSSTTSFYFSVPVGISVPITDLISVFAEYNYATYKISGSTINQSGALVGVTFNF